MLAIVYPSHNLYNWRHVPLRFRAFPFPFFSRSYFPMFTFTVRIQLRAFFVMQ